MTIGQRIARKRKELGLSQEGLGDELGVSRQAIYKWESDATLPEIDKLIALSRRFGVSVGWLLGEEDSAAPAGELSAEQLAMVREIVDRYLAARKENEPPSRLSKELRWVLLLLPIFVLCVAFIIVGNRFSARMDFLSLQYSNLQNSVSSIQGDVSDQVAALAGRVEEIMESQNNITADYTTHVVSTDLANNMVTFSFWVRPKVYEEGLTAWIEGEDERGRSSFGPYEANGGVFSGELDMALTDQTTLYVVLEQGGVRRTQLLDVYEDLLRATLPNPYLYSYRLTQFIDAGTNTLRGPIYAELSDIEGDNENRAAIRNYRIGLFADRTPVAWFTPTVAEHYLHGYPQQEEVLTLAPDGIVFDRNKEYAIAAAIWDEYGRHFVIQHIPVVWDGNSWNYSGDHDSGPHLSGWNY